ncbi:MAG: phosphoglycolate phosphatase [Haloarculaceae archaeon]
MTRPLAVDIDGTLTDENRAVDPRVFEVIREWPEPVVVATGKAFPYPVGLCEFLQVPINVIAENGGVTYTAADDALSINGDPEAAHAVADAFREAGYDLGWGDVDLTNRWRETEIAVSLDAPLEPLRNLAAEHGLEVVDTGFAYHVKSPSVDKGTGLRTAAASLGRDPGEFAAIGDSENDAAMFELAAESFAVANADETARAAADAVTTAAYADGFLEAVERLAESDDGDRVP